MLCRTELIRKLTSSERFFLAIILLTAAFLRGHDLFQIEHNVDHAYPIWQALTTLEHGVFPLVGQGTSVLFANPALTGYLYVPFVALTRSPLGAYILVISLNTLGVLLTFRAACGLLGTRVALLATLFMAVNPWVIEYSRTTWVQSLLPFFAPALAWLLWPVLLGKSSRPFRRLVLALTILTLYTQTYLLAFLIVVPVSLLVFIFRKNILSRALLTGAGIFALAGLIYAGGLLEQISSVQARLDEFSGSPRHLSGEAWSHAVRLVSGEDYELARGTNAPAHDAVLRHDLTHIAHVVVYGVLLVGIAIAVALILKPFLPMRFQSFLLTSGNWQVATILLVWFFVPVLLMSYVGQPVHPFYQLIGLPAGCILAGWGISRVLPASRRWSAWVLIAVAVPFAVLMSVNSSRYYEETAATPGAENLGALPLDYGLRLGRAINDYLPSGGVVFADVDEWTLNSLTGKTFPLVRDVRLPAVQIIPAVGGLVVQAQSGAIDGVPYSTRVENFILPDGWNVSIDAYAPGMMMDFDYALAMDTQQGIALRGYDFLQDDNHVTLTTFWRVEALTAGIEGSLFAPFVHIFDESGARVQIVDGQVIPGYEWHTSDIHIHRLEFDLPEVGAPFTLQVGQYDSVHGQNVIFLPDYTPTVQLQSALQ